MRIYKGFIFFASILLISSSLLRAQEYGAGLNWDDDLYTQSPKKALLISRDYQAMPRSISLKKYCPTPGNQGRYSTCVGWATAYAARTIMYAQENNWTDKAKITESAFSGAFIYKLIQKATDSSCHYGTFFNEALEIMRNRGVASHSQYRPMCPSSLPIPEEARKEALNYRIQDYHRLFNIKDEGSLKVRVVKKALAQSHPIVFGIRLSPSFYKAGADWQPALGETPAKSRGGHAMCIIGYDDDKFEGEGAFEIMNSWGTNWGDQGFTWIRYSDFGRFAKYAFEMIVPTEAKKYNLSGEISLRQKDGTSMPLKLRLDKGAVGDYQLEKAYPSGTEFQIFIKNNEPAYVYALGSDLSGKIFTLFPHKPDISAALNYQSNEVAIPGEKYFIRLDERPGKDYLVVIYSKKSLNLKSLIKKIERSSGSFIEKVKKTLAEDLVNPNFANFESKALNFRAQSKTDELVVLHLEIEHK